MPDGERMEGTSWTRRVRRGIRNLFANKRSRKATALGNELSITPCKPEESPAAQGASILGRSVPDNAITREELMKTANDQSLSAFFAKLPPEIRQVIYQEVWRAHIPSLRLHIHASGGDGGPLQHTACVVGRDDEPEGDATVIQPWPHWPRAVVQPGGAAETPPAWVWWAWCLRLRWGRHWKCQERVMVRWSPDEGVLPCLEIEEHGLLRPFLVCKRMYAEAMTSFLNTVTLIFTSSEDAYRFFVQQPHPWADCIRTLEFNFTHLDHLYLANSVSCRANGPCSSLPFGLGMWTLLVAAMQPPRTSLRGLKVTFLGRPRTEHADYLRLLETEAWDPGACYGGGAGTGKIEVEFTPLGKRYVRAGGGKMCEAEAAPANPSLALWGRSYL